MDLNRLRRICLILVLGSLVGALLSVWLSGTPMTLALFPVSASMGALIGIYGLAPDQRRTTRARRRGQRTATHTGWIIAFTIVVGQFLLPAILRSMGPAAEKGFGANLFFGLAVSFFIVLLDMRRPGYPDVE